MPENEVCVLINLGPEPHHRFVFGSASRTLEIRIDHDRYRRVALTPKMVVVGDLYRRVSGCLIEESVGGNKCDNGEHKEDAKPRKKLAGSLVFLCCALFLFAAPALFVSLIHSNSLMLCVNLRGKALDRCVYY